MRPLRLFVGLPIDTVSECNSLNHTKAIAVGLRALKLLGVHGVELPISWGVAMDGDWSSYLSVAEMAREAGLRLRVSLNLHADPAFGLSLPQCVAKAVHDDPELLFVDRSGQRRPDCLSFVVDELPVIDGKKPVELYEEFFRSFSSAFAHLMGTTIEDITIGLGPNGDLRYPSFPPSATATTFTGIGEFQCYNKYMIASLKRQAEASGNPLWGLSGPHDAPDYSSPPDSGFFRENGGSWATPYGHFFLSWYSGQLLSHANRVLSVGSAVFRDLPVALSAKVPLVHCRHDTRSRPAQLTAGFYNTVDRDGYDAVAKIFAENSCAMILSGIDLADKGQIGPGSLLSHMKAACERNGVTVYGENASAVMGESTSVLPGVDSFTYQRMGTEFFSPSHWPRFTEFVRRTAQAEVDGDDLPSNEGMASVRVRSMQGNDREMQAV